MNRYITRLFALLMLICLAVSCAGTALAVANNVQSRSDGKFTFTLVDGLACNIRYQGLSDSVVIPGKFGDNRAGTIGEGAFMNYSFVKKVTIKSNLKSIGAYTFYGCSGLTSVSIPKSVKFIGERAFDGCRNLTLTVVKDSYAARYAEENGIPFVFAK